MCVNVDDASGCCRSVVNLDLYSATATSQQLLDHYLIIIVEDNVANAVEHKMTDLHFAKRQPTGGLDNDNCTHRGQMAPELIVSELNA